MGPGRAARSRAGRRVHRARAHRRPAVQDRPVQPGRRGPGRAEDARRQPGRPAARGPRPPPPPGLAPCPAAPSSWWTGPRTPTGLLTWPGTGSRPTPSWPAALSPCGSTATWSRSSATASWPGPCPVPSLPLTGPGCAAPGSPRPRCRRPLPGPFSVHRKVPRDGVSMVTRQRLRVGATYAGKIVTVHVEDTTSASPATAPRSPCTPAPSSAPSRGGKPKSTPRKPRACPASPEPVSHVVSRNCQASPETTQTADGSEAMAIAQIRWCPVTTQIARSKSLACDEESSTTRGHRRRLGGRRQSPSPQG